MSPDIGELENRDRAATKRSKKLQNQTKSQNKVYIASHNSMRHVKLGALPTEPHPAHPPKDPASHL